MAHYDYNGVVCRNYADCGTDEPVSKKVERLERDKESLEKELADAKAKLAAEAEAKKPKTVGEHYAEKMVEVVDGHVQQYLAAAINKADADARAEQREKDAKLCEDGAERYRREGFPDVSVTAMLARAYDIRMSK